MNGTEWLDEALWQRLNAPTAEGSTLPNAAYVDPGFFLKEQACVFKKNWVFAEFAHKLSDTRTVYPVQMSGQSLLLTKDTDGVIRAFHNVCIHRGAALVGGGAVGRHDRRGDGETAAAASDDATVAGGEGDDGDREEAAEQDEGEQACEQSGTTREPVRGRRRAWATGLGCHGAAP